MFLTRRSFSAGGFTRSIDNQRLAQACKSSASKSPVCFLCLVDFKFPIHWMSWIFVWKFSRLSPNSEVEGGTAIGARPSGRFTVGRDEVSRASQTVRTLKRRKRRAPAQSLAALPGFISEYGFNGRHDGRGRCLISSPNSLAGKPGRGPRRLQRPSALFGTAAAAISLPGSRRLGSSDGCFSVYDRTRWRFPPFPTWRFWSRRGQWFFFPPARARPVHPRADLPRGYACRRTSGK